MISITVIVAMIFLVMAAYYAKFLRLSGAIAAFFVGISIYAGFQVNGMIVLAAFFLSSSIFSKYKKEKKGKMEERLDKDSRRDWLQVCANGGVAAMAALLYATTQESFVWLYLFIISLASSNSDTWASELGSLSKQKPFSVRNWRKVDSGTSGAVSLLGTVAALAGSFLISIVAYYLFSIPLYIAIIIGICGFCGNLIDTWLGAFVQAEYKCTVCGETMERTTHCGTNTKKIKGLGIFNNDVVNIVSCVGATLLGLIIYPFL